MKEYHKIETLFERDMTGKLKPTMKEIIIAFISFIGGLSLLLKMFHIIE